MEGWRKDRRFLTGVVAMGLACWLVYCAVEPHQFWHGGDSTNAPATLFGWDAPGVRARAGHAPDRLWIAELGWVSLSFAAGWIRPRLWAAVGVCTVLPTWLVYIPTAPRDDDGLWGVGVIVLPMTIVVFASFAWLGGKLQGFVKTRPSVA